MWWENGEEDKQFGVAGTVDVPGHFIEESVSI